MSRITLTTAACEALRADEVIFFDWHVTGLCCADSGEFSVRSLRRSQLPRRARRLGTDLVYAHPTAWTHLVELPVTIDCRPLWRWRQPFQESKLHAPAGLIATREERELMARASSDTG